MGENITALFNAGADAFTNLYDVIIEFPGSLTEKEIASNDVKSIAIRIQDFTPPSLNPATYTINYKAISLKRIAPKIEGERTLQIPMRIDSNYKYYELFKKWKKLYFDEVATDISFSSNFSASEADRKKYFGTIYVIGHPTGVSLVKLTDVQTDPVTYAQKNNAILYTFKTVACTNVTEPNFTRESATPLQTTLTFMFAGYIPPENQKSGAVPAELFTLNR